MLNFCLYKPCAMCLSGLHFQPCAGSEPDCNCCLSNKYTYMQLRSPEVTRVNFHLTGSLPLHDVHILTLTHADTHIHTHTHMPGYTLMHADTHIHAHTHAWLYLYLLSVRCVFERVLEAAVVFGDRVLDLCLCVCVCVCVCVRACVCASV